MEDGELVSPFESLCSLTFPFYAAVLHDVLATNEHALQPRSQAVQAATGS